MEFNLVIPGKETELIKAQQLAEKLSSIPIIEVIDDRTEHAASDQLKAYSCYEKEFDDIVEPIKKEIKAPGVALDKSLKPISDYRKEWRNMQKQTLGKYLVNKDIQKTHTVFSASTAKEVINAQIIDLALFAETLLQNGQRAAFVSIFSDYNTTKLNAWCEMQGIDFETTLYPGLEGKKVAKVNNR
jgi:hypothetical protein